MSSNYRMYKDKESTEGKDTYRSTGKKGFVAHQFKMRPGRLEARLRNGRAFLLPAIMIFLDLSSIALLTTTKGGAMSAEKKTAAFTGLFSHERRI